MKTAVLLLVLCAALAVRAAPPKVEDAKSFCGVTGAKSMGGWSVVDTEDIATLYDEVTQLDDYLVLSAQEFSSNATIACPDDFDTNIIHACKQVVNGLNFKFLFSVECMESDESYILSSEVYVPAGAEDSSTTEINSVDLEWEGTYDELESVLYADE